MHPDILAFHDRYDTPAHIVRAEKRMLLTPKRIERLRRCGKRIGVTASCFDLKHPGHDLMLEEAKQHCDYLLVLLQSDPTIDRPHKNKPVEDLHARFTALRGSRFVDRIWIYDTEADLYDFLAMHARVNGGFIDVRIIGEDYIGKNFTGRDLPIRTEYNWRGHDYSTTNRRRAVYEAEVARIRSAAGGSRRVAAVASPAP
jgi:glycerol-3-phosphate cytidylyltransferase